MSSSVIKVLQINNGNKFFGGGSAFLFNVYQNINKDKIQFDFLTPNNTTYETKRGTIENQGGHIFEFHTDQSSFKGLYSFAVKLWKFLGTHHYDIVHINTGDNRVGCVCAIIAKRRKIKVIYHSHNTAVRKLWKKILVWPLKWIAYWNSDLLLACSADAAYSKFPKSIVDKGKVQIIKNGIDTKKYAYNEKTRDQIRNTLNIHDSFVIGNVGRLTNQKNQSYLLKVFKEFLKLNENAVLLLVGEGEDQQEIEEQAIELNILDKILFVGYQENVAPYYQAMDVFVFPSLYEGLAIVLLEAQTCGLPCFINEELPKEIDITELINRLSINAAPSVWSKGILSYATSKYFIRCSHEQEIINAGHSIQDTTRTLTELYESLLNKK